MRTGRQYCFSCMQELQGLTNMCPLCHAALPYQRRDLNDLPAGLPLKKRYLIGRTLGRGGFGATYISRDNKTDKILTIKEYFPDFACERNVLKQHDNEAVIKNGREDKFRAYQKEFRAEAQHLKRLRGVPGVVQFFDYFEELNTSYLVMEYLEGQTLKDMQLAQNRPFAVQEAADYVLHLLYVLSRVHAKGVLHRDISPDNIFLTRSGQIYLIDFGSSSLISQTTMTGFTKGVYTAPEQRLSGRQGPATDLYAVGITLFTLLMKRPPKEAEGVQLEQLPDFFPPGLREIYQKATQRDMAQRYRSAEEMARALSRATGLPLPSAAINRRRRLKKLLRFMLLMMLGVVAAILLALFGDQLPDFRGMQPAAPAAETPVPSAIAATQTPAAETPPTAAPAAEAPVSEEHSEHSFGDWSAEYSSSCRGYRILVRACRVCGEKEWKAEHIEIQHAWQGGSCTEPGICAKCGQTAENASGHHWRRTEEKAPGCTSAGTERMECSVCGQKQWNSLPPLGHAMIYGVCTRCGASGQTD